MKRLANENFITNTGHLHEIASKVKMRSAHRRREIHHTNTERALKRSNANIPSPMASQTFSAPAYNMLAEKSVQKVMQNLCIEFPEMDECHVIL